MGGQAAPIRTKGYAVDPSLVMPGNWALPDWLESRGGTSQESLYFLVFRVVRLQQNGECFCKPFVLRLPAIAIEANCPRSHHACGEEVSLLLMQQCPLEPCFPFLVLRCGA